MSSKQKSSKIFLSFIIIISSSISIEATDKKKEREQNNINRSE